MRLAFILILLGFGTKAGIAPMHTWKPDAYSEAPVPVAAMLAAGVLNCALYGLVRFYILTSKCLGPHFASQLLIVFGLLSMGVAVPFILVQRSFRRLLAYSSIDHCGIMVLALGFGGPLGILGMFLHMTFHAVTKPLLFFCAGNIQQHLNTDLFRKAKGGLVHSMPWSGAAFLMGALGGHRVASLQPVPERIHHPARGLRRRLRFLSRFFSWPFWSRFSRGFLCTSPILFWVRTRGFPTVRAAVGRNTPF